MTNFATQLGITPSINQNLYNAINSCKTDKDVINYLGANRSDLQFVLEHLPSPAASDPALLEGIVKMIPSSQIAANPRLAEISSFLANPDVELRTRIKQAIDNFTSKPMAAQAQLTKELQEAIIATVIHTGKLNDTLSKAPSLISEIAKESKVSARFDANPEKINQEIQERAAFQALEQGKPELALKFFRPEQLDALIAPRIKMENLDNVLKLRSSLPRTEKIDAALGAVALVIGTQYMDELNKQLAQLKQLTGTELSEDQKRERLRLYDITNEQKAQLKTYNDQLNALNRFVPEAVTKFKTSLDQRIGQLHEREIDAIKGSANYDPFQRAVVSTYPIFKTLLDNPNPQVNDFLNCFRDVATWVEPSSDYLRANRNNDLLLGAFMNQGSILLMNAGEKVRPMLETTKVDFSGDHAIVGNIEDLLRRVPPIFGNTIELNVQMQVQDDILIGNLAQLYPDTNPSTFAPWIQANIIENGIDIEFFKDWLLNNEFNPHTNPPPALDMLVPLFQAQFS